MRTVEIDEDVLEEMFQQVEYLHDTMDKVIRLMTVKDADEWLTSKETAEILRIGYDTLNNLKRYGKIPFSQIDGRVMFRASDVLTFMANSKRSP